MQQYGTDSDEELGGRSGGGGGCPAMDEPQGCFIYGCGGCCGLMTMILCLASFQGLHATKFGLTRNAFTGVVNFGSTYHGGRNFIGFWNKYLEFPATLQPIEWLDSSPHRGSTSRDLTPMNVRTSDGLMVKLGIVAQYTINKEHLSDIYRTFKLDIEGFFISNLRSSIQETIATFRVTELYEDRLKVRGMLMEMCKKVCKNDLKGYLSCWRIELHDVELDRKIEQANIREQVEKQKQQTERMIQNASLIRAETEVIVSDYARQVRIVEAGANAKAYNITQEATSNAAYMQQQARADALKIIKAEVSVGAISMNADEQLNYLEKLALIADPKGAMVYGNFETASVLFRQNEL